MGIKTSARALALVICAGLCTVALGAECDDPIDLGRGPVSFEVPASYDPERPAPLVVLLHGRGASGATQEAYFRLGEFAEELGFLYAFPDGILDTQGARFWNATDACCDFFATGVDDSGYLRGLVEAVRAQCAVDPYRIYFVGHSNGGYMAYRMACDHADLVSGIASLAGATFRDPEDCDPGDAVQVLHIHGTFDTVIRYGGGLNGGVAYPGAVESAEIWATYNGCSLDSETLPDRIDLDSNVMGAETQVRRWPHECDPGGSAELWTVAAGGHIPDVTPDFRRGVLEHLLEHPSCRGRERLKRVRCSASGTVRVKLLRGVPGDAYSVDLEGEAPLEGRLNVRGKATLKVRNQPRGAGAVTVRWGCGAGASRTYSCP